MKVAELRKFLDSKGLPRNGNKSVLVERARSYWNHLQKAEEAKARNEETEGKAKLIEGDAKIKRDEVAQSLLEPPCEGWIKEETSEDHGKISMEPENGDGCSVKPEILSPNVDAVLAKSADVQDVSAESDVKVSMEKSNNDVGKDDAGTLDNDVLMKEPAQNEVADVEMSPEKIANGNDKETQRVKSRKRRLHKPATVYSKLRKVTLQGKSPLQIINEVFPGVKYELLESGDIRNPWFKMSACVNGVPYYGESKSKKAARIATAEAIIRDYATLLQSTIDFTSDEIFSPEPMSMYFHDVRPNEEITSPEQPSSSDADVPAFLANMMMSGASPTPTPNKPKGEDIHPVMLLNQKIAGVQYVVEPVGSNFEARTTIQEVEYSGQGRNKKLAKFACAVKVLKGHFGINSNQGENLLPVPSTAVAEEIPTDVGNLPDFVCDKIKTKFGELTEGNERNAQHKVLAGIVMTRTSDLNVDEGEVICVATGTKCIGGEYITTSGTPLNDCHAEIICRRGLRRFLYNQLLNLTRNEECIFEKCGENIPGYKLKNDVFFHLYISTSPCGDGRVFSPRETVAKQDNHPNRFSRGQLRTKIEAGEGTIPVQQHHSLSGDGSQLWDSVIGGERLLTMSCSDKLARWNLLGVQGALLTLFIDPIYYSSIILGSLFHGSHLSRGLYTRIQDAVTAVDKDCDVVKPPFKIYRPLLAPISTITRRKPVKAPNFCFHWTVGDSQPTIVNTVTGKCQDDSYSNLCKMEMLVLITKLLESNLTSKVDIPASDEPRGYNEVKKLAKEYQELKRNLHRGFNEAGLGIWVKKPEEINFFKVPPDQC